MKSGRNAVDAGWRLMKPTPRSYEWQVDQWIEIDPQPPSRPLLHRLAALLSAAFAIAVIFAVGIVVAGLALVLLPVALLALLVKTRKPR